jgi:dTDP-glucose 4,6-dehydratase
MGAEVICLDNFSTGSRSNLDVLPDSDALTILDHDVTQAVRLDGTVDVVVHCASPASPRDYLRMPLETLQAGSTATLSLLDLSREKNARFVLLSTSEVYGEPQVHPQPESYWGNVNPIGPRSVYDEAKRFAEAATYATSRQHHVNVGVVRIFNTYGPRMRPDDGRAVPTFISQALRDEEITVTGDGSQTRSLCYVDDLVEGLVRMIQSRATAGPVNLGNPEEITMLDLAGRVKRLTSSGSRIVFRERPVDDPTRRCPDISEAVRTLGWKPHVCADEGLSATVEWFRNGMGRSSKGIERHELDIHSA